MTDHDAETANSLQGLSTDEATLRLTQYGPNEVAEEKPHPLLALLHKFWSPVPWMLEVTIVLQLVLGKPDEAAVIAVLLVVNAVLSFLQESRANNALALLLQRLDIQARVLRDGHWQRVQALIFVMLVFTGLGNVYLVRERRHFWQSRPSRWLMLATLLDIAVVSVIASQGILMAAISPALIGGLMAVALVYLVMMDFLKIRIFRRIGLA